MERGGVVLRVAFYVCSAFAGYFLSGLAITVYRFIRAWLGNEDITQYVQPWLDEGTRKIAGNLKATREIYRISRATMARELGITQAGLAAIERGQIDEDPLALCRRFRDAFQRLRPKTLPPAEWDGTEI